MTDYSTRTTTPPEQAIYRSITPTDAAFVFAAIAEIEVEITRIKKSGCYSLMTPSSTVYAAALRRVADRFDKLDRPLGKAMLRLGRE